RQHSADQGILRDGRARGRVWPPLSGAWARESGGDHAPYRRTQDPAARSREVSAGKGRRRHADACGPEGHRQSRHRTVIWRHGPMPLFEGERHEPLAEIVWDEARARSVMERIAADVERSFNEGSLWPVHPLDRSAERPPDSMKPLYFGATGVIWALTYLAAAGATPCTTNFLPTVRAL